MTTYVKCKNCGGNFTNCPKCGKQTIIENSNMFNK